MIIAVVFANPLLLGGLALVAAPIIIHLLSRRQYRRTPWAATRFLLEAERKIRRRTRFEQWLLVALRCLALGLLALFMARPQLESAALAALIGRGAGVERCIIIDDSASLGFRSGPRNDFEGARGSAAQLVRALRAANPAEPLTVLTTSAPESPLADREVLSDTQAESLFERIEALRVSDAPAAPSRVLGRVAERFATMPPGSRVAVYVISDFQASEWLNVGEQESELLAPLRGVEQLASVALLPITASTRDNLAVRAPILQRRRPIAGTPSLVSVEVANFSRRARERLTLRVELDGAALPDVTIDALPPNQTRSASIEVTLPSAAPHVLSVSLSEPDGLPVDDVARLTIMARDALRVVLANGAPSLDPQADEATLLRAALAPPGPFASGISIEVVDPADLDALELSDVDVLALCNVPAPSQSQADSLERFVAAGGGLLVFLGDNIGDGADYNRVLYRDGRGLLPLPIERTIAAPSGAAGYGLRALAAHPVTAMFPEGSAALSEYVRFFRFARLGAPADTSSGRALQIVAEYGDPERSPAIIESGLGAGRVLVFTSTADTDWNDWARALDGSYVVTMLEAAHYVARSGVGARPLHTGAPFELTLDPQRYEPRVRLRWPEPAATPPLELSSQSSAIAGELQLVGPRLLQAGLYQLDLTPRQEAPELRPVPVHVDPVESNLAVATRAELLAAGQGLPLEVLDPQTALAMRAEAAQREIWPALLAAMIAVLLAEQALAWWFGAGRQGGAQAFSALATWLWPRRGARRAA